MIKVASLKTTLVVESFLKSIGGGVVRIKESSQGCADGGVEGAIFSNLQERWSKVSRAARELATVFSLNQQLVNSSKRPLPPTEGVSAHHCQ